MKLAAFTSASTANNPTDDSEALKAKKVEIHLIATSKKQTSNHLRSCHPENLNCKQIKNKNN